MKSIMEQASSILKAIEKAWNSAENPKEFTVKIFEKEEKNFFGMTTKPAKIGIFFSDTHHTNQDRPTQKCRPEQKEHAQKTAPQQKSAPAHPQKQAPQPKPQAQSKIPAKQQADPVEKQKTPQQTKPAVPAAKKISATWSDAMVTITTSWINKTLSLMNVANPDFTTEIANRNLKITFLKPLLEDPAAEKQLFRSFAHLIIASLRNQYKQEIKDLKVVLIRPQD